MIGNIVRPRLSIKQRVFLDHFLTSFNAADAAKRAGYKTKANVRGSELLSSTSIQKELSYRLNYLGVSANETIIHLSRIARGSMGTFIRDGDIDVSSEEALAQLDIIKKYRRDVSTRYDENGNEIRTIHTEIELYDKLAALTLFMKHHGLLAQEQTGNVTNNTLVIQSIAQAQEVGLDADQIRKELARLMGGGVAPSETIIEQSDAPEIPENTPED